MSALGHAVVQGKLTVKSLVRHGQWLAAAQSREVQQPIETKDCCQMHSQSWVAEGHARDSAYKEKAEKKVSR